MKSFPSSERIYQEFKNLNSIPLVNFGNTVGLFEENNIYRWMITYLGPKDTPYKGGFFVLEVIIPKLYPEQAPKFIFNTPIYHPNVNMKKSSINFQLGQVAFKPINFWKPSYSLKEIITKLYYIFYYPNLDLAYSLEMAKEYKENINLFEKKVRYFTHKYASPIFKWQKLEYWDFSCDENALNSIKIKPIENTINNKDNCYDGNQLITFYFDINGIIEARMNCKVNELVKDVIKKVLNHYGISEKNDILVIYNSKRIKLDVPLGKYHIKNLSKITMIFND